MATLKLGRRGRNRQDKGSQTLWSSRLPPESQWCLSHGPALCPLGVRAQALLGIVLLVLRGINLVLLLQSPVSACHHSVHVTTLLVRVTSQLVRATAQLVRATAQVGSMMNLGELNLKLRWTKVSCNSQLHVQHQTVCILKAF